MAAAKHGRPRFDRGSRDRRQSAEPNRFNRQTVQAARASHIAISLRREPAQSACRPRRPSIRSAGSSRRPFEAHLDARSRRRPSRRIRWRRSEHDLPALAATEWSECTAESPPPVTAPGGRLLCAHLLDAPSPSENEAVSQDAVCRLDRPEFTPIDARDAAPALAEAVCRSARSPAHRGPHRHGLAAILCRELARMWYDPQSMALKNPRLGRG